MPVRPREPPRSARAPPARAGLWPAAGAPPGAAPRAERSPRPSLRPPLVRPSARARVPAPAAPSSVLGRRRGRPLLLPPTRGSLALRRGCSPAPLPAGGRALRGAAGRGQRAVRRGRRVPWSCWARVPRAGAAQPAVSPPALASLLGAAGASLLPLTSAPQLALVSRLLLCSRPSSRSLSAEEDEEDEEDEDEELRVRPECL